ncbi:MAG: hypothetical protein ACHQQS_09175 [Thermoanaerobaculales bacterium]
MPNKVNLSVIADLKEAALSAVKHGHSLEAAVILFQMVEGLLRIAVRVFGRTRGVSENVLAKVADKEQSFARLVMHLDLVCPRNGLSARLLALNTSRNRLMHSLFGKFQSVDQIRDELNSFGTEAVALNKEIRQLLGVEREDGKT